VDHTELDDRERGHQRDQRPDRARHQRDAGEHQRHSEIARVAAEAVRARADERLAGAVRRDRRATTHERPEERPSEPSAAKVDQGRRSDDIGGVRVVNRGSHVATRYYKKLSKSYTTRSMRSYQQ